MAQVLLEAAAAHEFDELPTAMKSRVLRLIERLEKWPAVSGAKPLRGALAGKFRLRTGDYRVQFHVTANDVVIERIGHRDGFYED